MLGVEAAEMVAVEVVVGIGGITGEAGIGFGVVVVETADIRAFLTVEDILGG